MSENAFALRLVKMPDEELIRIAYSKPEDGFIEEAIEAARKEIERRGMGSGEVTHVIQQIENDPEEIGNRENAPLSAGGKIGFFLAGILMGIPLGVFYAVAGLGYKRKVREGLKWTIVGFACTILLSLALAVAISTGA